MVSPSPVDLGCYGPDENYFEQIRLRSNQGPLIFFYPEDEDEHGSLARLPTVREEQKSTKWKLRLRRFWKKWTTRGARAASGSQPSTAAPTVQAAAHTTNVMIAWVDEKDVQVEVGHVHASKPDDIVT